MLTEAQVARCHELMERATWVDGRVTAGHQSAQAKHNLQIAEGTPEAREMGDMIVAALERNPLFISAALPLRVFPPLFNRYEPRHDLRRPRGQRDPPGDRHAVPPAHRSVGHAVPQPRPTTTTAASWWSRTPTARTR